MISASPGLSPRGMLHLLCGGDDDPCADARNDVERLDRPRASLETARVLHHV